MGKLEAAGRGQLQRINNLKHNAGKLTALTSMPALGPGGREERHRKEEATSTGASAAECPPSHARLLADLDHRLGTQLPSKMISSNQKT